MSRVVPTLLGGGVRLGSTVRLASVGAPPGVAGLAAQATAAWETVLARLGEAGVAAGEVVHVVEHVATSAVAEAGVLGTARTAALGATPVAVTTVVVPGFTVAGRLVELEVTAGGFERASGGVVVADGVVHLPSILPLDATGRVIAPGDLAGQVDACFRRAVDLLAAVGLGPEQIVLTVDHSTAATRREYRRTGAVRREYLGPVMPGAAGILQDRLLHPDALVSLDVTASRHPLRGVNPGWERYERLTYGPGLIAGPLLVMSGQGALDVETEQAVHAGDLRAQTEYTYANIVRVVEAAGGTVRDLVHVVEYLTPAAEGGEAEVDAGRRAVLGDHAVTTTRVYCAGLLRPEFLIEVIPLAVAP